MASTVLLSEINRDSDYPLYVEVVAPNNSGYVSITTNNWTDQMFYELPNIQFGIYTLVNGVYVKYLQDNFFMRTYVPDVIMYSNCSVCRTIKNVPESFYIYINPIFDNNAISARNMLIQNGIEHGDIWNAETNIFNITVEFLTD